MSSRVKPCLPAGTPDWVTPELLAETLEVWLPYHPDGLTEEEALTILLNIGGVLSILGGNQP